MMKIVYPRTNNLTTLQRTRPFKGLDPKYTNIIVAKRDVSAKCYEAGVHCLGDEQAIKRIAMMGREGLNMT